MTAARIALAGADLGYAGQPVLRGVSLALLPGEFVAVLGPNGSGKTTLLRSLLGFVAPLAGRIEREPGLRIGYVPQRETLDDRYPLTAADVTAMGTLIDPASRWRPRGAAQRARVRTALEACGALGFATRRYAELSGGQRQRVLIARALATAPTVLLLDEPTAGVDAASESAILATLAGLRRERELTVWLVTHHEEAVGGHVDRIARVADGRVALEARA